MLNLSIYFEIPPNNINKIYQIDYKVVHSIGNRPNIYSYNFNDNTRTLVYNCNNDLASKYIKKIRKSRIKNLRWRVENVIAS
jgi:hypothetical protein